jgi:hypothetical protein
MRSRYSRALCIALAIAVAGGAAACKSDSDGLPKNTASGSFGEGVVQVGKDVTPGVYAATVPAAASTAPAATSTAPGPSPSHEPFSGCYIQLTKDDSGDITSFLATESFGPGARVLVLLAAGQYLRTGGCGTFTPAKTPKKPATTFASGMFRVGIDIAAGSYTATVPQDSAGCFVGFSSDGAAMFSSILTTNDFDPGAQATVSVTDGQWLQTDACGTWNKA